LKNIFEWQNKLVFIKGIDYTYDVSVELLEWLLFSKEQNYGAVYIYIYEGLHLNILKVIR